MYTLASVQPFFIFSLKDNGICVFYFVFCLVSTHCWEQKQPVALLNKFTVCPFHQTWLLDGAVCCGLSFSFLYCCLNNSPFTIFCHSCTWYSVHIPSVIIRKTYSESCGAIITTPYSSPILNTH